ncbi:MAG: matrixin family metalloprotease [Armatimonadota bacterium]
MTIAAVLPLAIGLAGCGGGGGTGAPSDISKDVPGSTPSSPTSPIVTPGADSGTRSFVPNYRTELVAARRWDKPVVTVGFTAPVDANGAARNVGPLVQQAIDLWNRKIDSSIRFQLTNADDADVKVRWVVAGTLPSDAIGRTEVRFRNADQVLVSAAVAIEQSLPDNFQVQVIAHELGHSLGIEGHSANNSDVMFTNAHLPVEITTRDQNTILQAYYSDASRAVQPGLVTGDTSTASSAAQYLCGGDELSGHSAHAHR